MAQKVNIELVDDIDGTEAAETVSFALDGAAYEIDLSAENAEALRDEMAVYVETARRVSARRAGRSTRGGARAVSAESRARTQAVRRWARDNGFEVSERGRISNQIAEAYENRESVQEAPGTAAGRRGRKRAG
ncbi:histone-like nucleoid-structuring protein Lsr2 [Amycolatopsis benzoatilytica]|uniref:histone-like nucleoid-structuring protein Lsr2 n=1 Tax=Amycolatopsis benzoatilytica TaxID=346045 RepID=UPI00035C81B6|nr:Lsr2 family protein [Amycolatopsis benzoatilytica]